MSEPGGDAMTIFGEALILLLRDTQAVCAAVVVTILLGETLRIATGRWWA